MRIFLYFILFIPLIVAVAMFTILYYVCDTLAYLIRKLLIWMKIDETEIIKNQLANSIKETSNDN